MEKTFRLSASQIKPLVKGLGSCYASDRITVDGAKVGYMYREAGDNELDSGWRFLAGDEPDEYMANRSNFELYDVNTIANYDPTIVPLLSSQAPCAFARSVSSSDLTAIPPPRA